MSMYTFSVPVTVEFEGMTELTWRGRKEDIARELHRLRRQIQKALDEHVDVMYFEIEMPKPETVPVDIVED